MKRGFSGVVVTLLLSLFVIIIILSTVYVKTWKTGSGFFESLPKSVGSGQVDSGSISGGDLAKNVIAGGKVEVMEQLAKELVSCWNVVQAGKIQNRKCTVVTTKDFEGVITAEELASVVGKQNPAAAKNLQADQVVANTQYLVCADYDWISSDDLFLRANLNFDCE